MCRESVNFNFFYFCGIAVNLFCKKLKRLPDYFVVGLLGMIVGIAIFQVVGKCFSTNMVFLKVVADETPLFSRYYPLVIVPLVLIFTALIVKLPRMFAVALLPWICYIPFLFFDLNIFSIIVFILLSGITVCRTALLLPVSLFAAKIAIPGKYRLWLLLTVLFTAGFTACGVYMAHVALKVQFLCFGDWGIFTEVAANTLDGNFLLSNWHGGINFFSHHFMPGFFVLFTPLIWLFRSPYTTVVFGALTLWGSAMLIYYFARTRQLSPPYAFCLAMTYLLYPSLSNLNISIFYGFHVIYLFIPVFILFYVFYERERYMIAFLIFLYSLTVQETVGVFWVGWGVVQFLSGRKKDGIIYAVIGAVFFIICIKLIIPACGVTQYIYVQERYCHLGSGILEIMFSPIIKPYAFWGSLFTVKNLAVMLLLLAPSFMVAFNRPLLLLCSMPQLLFVFIQNNQEVINLCLQYQSETVAMIAVTCVLGLVAVLRNEKLTSWTKILMLGLLRKDMIHDRKNIASAMIAGLIVSSLLANYFYSLSYYGCHSFKPVAQRPDCTPVMDEIKKIVPPDIAVAASERVAAHFMIRNQVFPVSFDKEYRIYDLSDCLDGSSLFHNAMLDNKDYGLIWFKLYKNHQFFVFKKDAKNKYPKPVNPISPQDWEVSGQTMVMPELNDDFQVKAKLDKSQEGRLYLVCTVKLKRKINYECEINAHASFNNKNYYWLIPFGYGYYPASKTLPGEVFKVMLPLPVDWTGISSADIKIQEKR